MRLNLAVALVAGAIGGVSALVEASPVTGFFFAVLAVFYYEIDVLTVKIEEVQRELRRL